ncbi:MAG: hypothetical protein ACREPR_08425 [Brasilonema sp.]
MTCSQQRLSTLKDSMTEALRNQLVADLARGTLEQIEPDSDELELFEATSEEFFRNPDRVFEGVQVKDRPLGSGFGIGEIILTPVLLWLANKLLDLAWSLVVQKPIENKLSERVNRFINRLLSKLGLVKPAETSTFPTLTPTQLQQLREKTLADAQLQKLVREYKLSNAMMARLVNVMVANIPVKITALTEEA